MIKCISRLNNQESPWSLQHSDAECVAASLITLLLLGTQGRVPWSLSASTLIEPQGSQRKICAEAAPRHSEPMCAAHSLIHWLLLLGARCRGPWSFHASMYYDQVYFLDRWTAKKVHGAFTQIRSYNDRVIIITREYWSSVLRLRSYTVCY